MLNSDWRTWLPGSLNNLNDPSSCYTTKNGQCNGRFKWLNVICPGGRMYHPAQLRGLMSGGGDKFYSIKSILKSTLGYFFMLQLPVCKHFFAENAYCLLVLKKMLFKWFFFYSNYFCIGSVDICPCFRKKDNQNCQLTQTFYFIINWFSQTNDQTFLI